MPDPSRRRFMISALGAGAVLAASSVVARRAAGEPLVIIGAGPSGASAALSLRLAHPDTPVVLVERDPTRLAPRLDRSPHLARGVFSRPTGPVDVLRLQEAGVQIVLDDVTGVDWTAQRVDLLSGRTLPFGTLITAPGIAAVEEGIAGFDSVARHLWPAAWGSAREARRLRGQLATMPDNGHVVLRLPPDAGGYARIAAQRALQIVQSTPSTVRLTVLDADPKGRASRVFADQVTAQDRARIAWVGAQAGGRVTSVDAAAGVLTTTAGDMRADVVNFVPRQGAAPIARTAGLVDDSGWCPCDGYGQSLLRPAARVLGDARKTGVRSFAAAQAQGAGLVL